MSPANTPLVIPTDRDRGRGDYTAYHALWHLAKIGVVTDLTGFASEGWDQAATRITGGIRRTRVALIDTSVAVKHPNLSPAINTDLAIDFFSAPLGAADTPAALATYIADHGDALPAAVPTAVAAHWHDLLTHLKGTVQDPHASAVRPATNPNFSAHGTAMAGLIGARPLPADAVAVTPVRIFDPATGTLQELPSGQAVAFAYAGVDPFCEIVPISTNFDPEPDQLIRALLYAALIEADIIVLARDFPAPWSLAPDVPLTPRTAETPWQQQEIDALSRALGVGLSVQELTAWDDLQALTIALSRGIPFVCAAGNGAQDSIMYPGALAAADNGIIAVGACAASGQPAAYSPVSDQITVYAPSGDGERLDRGLQRRDTQSAHYNPGDQSAAYRDSLGNLGDPLQSDVTGPGIHAPQDLVSTDVPGRAGYNSSPNAQVFGRDDAVLDYRSAYCRFSGTSGAAALTAGMLSLAMSAGQLTRGGAQTGIDAKVALCRDTQIPKVNGKPVLNWAAFRNQCEAPT